MHISNGLHVEWSFENKRLVTAVGDLKEMEVDESRFKAAIFFNT